MIYEVANNCYLDGNTLTTSNGLPRWTAEILNMGGNFFDDVHNNIHPMAGAIGYHLDAILKRYGVGEELEAAARKYNKAIIIFPNGDVQIDYMSQKTFESALGNSFKELMKFKSGGDLDYDTMLGIARILFDSDKFTDFKTEGYANKYVPLLQLNHYKNMKSLEKSLIHSMAPKIDELINNALSSIEISGSDIRGTFNGFTEIVNSKYSVRVNMQTFKEMIRNQMIELDDFMYDSTVSFSYDRVNDLDWVTMAKHIKDNYPELSKYLYEVWL